MKQPRTLEREHVIEIVKESVNNYYPDALRAAVAAARAVDKWRFMRMDSGETWPAGDYHNSEQDLTDALAELDKLEVPEEPRNDQ